jgi:hypothetical protein
MIFTEIFIALIVAIFFSALLVFTLRWERPDRKGIIPSMLFLFFIIFFFTWAGGIWLAPLGPGTWTVDWLPFFIVGLIITLMLITLIPPRRRIPRSTVEVVEKKRDEQIERETARALNVFFWLLLAVLIITIVARYLIYTPPVM